MHAIGVILGANARPFREPLLDERCAGGGSGGGWYRVLPCRCHVGFLQHFSFEKTINGVRESVPPVLVDSADEDDASEERALTVDERCEVLSQQKGLTKRETEVLHLLAAR